MKKIMSMLLMSVFVLIVPAINASLCPGKRRRDHLGGHA